MPHAIRPSFLRSVSGVSQKDKPRLYVALYSRRSGHGDCDAYHWALVVGPDAASRTDLTHRFHLDHSRSAGIRKYSMCGSLFSEEELDGSSQADLLCLIAIAKVLDLERLSEVLREQRPRSSTGEASTGCLQWVQDAFAAAHMDGKCLKSYFKGDEWADIERCAREYCRAKRRDGRFTDNGTWAKDSVSTYNFWERRETRT